MSELNQAMCFPELPAREGLGTSWSEYPLSRRRRTFLRHSRGKLAARGGGGRRRRAAGAGLEGGDRLGRSIKQFPDHPNP